MKNEDTKFIEQVKRLDKVILEYRTAEEEFYFLDDCRRAQIHVILCTLTGREDLEFPKTKNPFEEGTLRQLRENDIRRVRIDDLRASIGFSNISRILNTNLRQFCALQKLYRLF